MPRIQVVITETLSKVVEVEAPDKDVAEEIVKANYDNGEDGYILYADDWEKTEVYAR